MAIDQERAAEEECEVTLPPPLKELSTKELSEVFSLLDKAVEIVTQNYSDTQRSYFFRRRIENLSRPYKELYKENRKQAKRLSLLNFFKKL
jgi:hypothetical protein